MSSFRQVTDLQSFAPSILTSSSFICCPFMKNPLISFQKAQKNDKEITKGQSKILHLLPWLYHLPG